jgi:amidophosphoribosyltransferase
MLRLRKRPEHYLCKYKTEFYGYQKLSLMLEKQHNRGQDGAGIAGVKLKQEPGCPAWQLEKSARKMPLAHLLERIGAQIETIKKDHPEQLGCYPLAGELLLGHLRYGTFGIQGEAACHPFIRESSCLNRTLLMAGNFNLTNTAEIFNSLLETGHHPSSRQDGALILHLIGHYLEQALMQQQQPDVTAVLKRAAESFDGAFTLCGIFGDGHAFALRDASGIRPAFYYVNDEAAVVASERPAIQTAFDLFPEQVQELPPGHALSIDRDGEVEIRLCLDPKPVRKCVFERIYFSRGNDAEIHQERKAMGRALVPNVLKNLDDGIENAFVSYIPNTAQICFHGMLEELMKMQLNKPLRFGQIAVKDAKFRTFISDAVAREDFSMHVYDVTYGLIRPGLDTLIVIDDSIVRGNTIHNAILPMLDRLSPKKIIVASAAPPICYPDCYGIDMGSLKELVAFEALADLLRSSGQTGFLEQQGVRARAALKGEAPLADPLRELYGAFSFDELVRAITDRLRPAGLKAELAVVFQTPESLRQCCPGHTGDWYFTGEYPTPGGYRVVNQALVNYLEHVNTRAY